MMNAGQNPSGNRWRIWRLGLGCGLLALVLAGCRGLPTRSEKQARKDLQEVTTAFQPGRPAEGLPQLTPETPIADFLVYAMLNQPGIAAAYYDYAAAVERVTQGRSLPDPQLSFQMDIKELVNTTMVGLGQAFPGPGKLRLRADVASADSQARYYRFEQRVLRTAFNLKQAYYRLFFLEDTLKVDREMLTLLTELEQIARAQNEAGKVTLQDVLRAQIEQDRLETDIENLEDSRHPLMAQFKAALGLKADEPDPSLPRQFESTPLALDADRLLALAYQANPTLKSLAAEVARAEASLRLAYKTRVPDFSVGVMADVKNSPALVRPQLGMTLPIWRDKIAAEIAEAQAGKSAAEARLSAEQIALAVDFAQRMFAFRESVRNLELLQQKLLVKAQLSLDVARAGYLAGQINFFNLIDAEQTLLNFQLAEVDARLQRELALAEVALVIVGLPPEGAPMLPVKQSQSKGARQ